MIEQKKRGELIIYGKKFRGRIFQVDGRDIEVYRIGALAAALKKTVQTIYAWEKEKLFPKPMFNVTARAGMCTHWYSKEQIINIQNVWFLFPLKTGRPRMKQAFFKGVQKVFHRLDIVQLKVKPREQQQDHHPDAVPTGKDRVESAAKPKN